MPKPLSGALAHKTSLEDIELITKMAKRYRDDEIARVLSKLGRKTGKVHFKPAKLLYLPGEEYPQPARLDYGLMLCSVYG